LPDRTGKPSEDELLRRLRVARETFMAGGELDDEVVRPEIRRSWFRSRSAGVSPNAPIHLHRGPLVNQDSSLLKAAHPVVRGLLKDLGDAQVWIQLVDRDGQIVGRWATSEPFEKMLEDICALGSVIDEGVLGTSALATLLEERRPVTVWGPEHYNESLASLSGAGAPIVHPGSGVLHGGIAVGCDLTVPMGLVASLVNQSARDIGAALVTGYSRADRELLDAYLQLERRGPRRPVIALNSRLWIANAAASARGSLLPTREDLWARVQDADRDAVDGEEVVVLDGYRLLVRPVQSGEDLIGGLVQVVGQRGLPRRPRTNDAPPLHAVASRPPSALDRRRVEAERLLVTAPLSLFHGPKHVGKTTLARRSAERSGLVPVFCDATDLLGRGLPDAVSSAGPICLVVRRLDAVPAHRVPELEETLLAAGERLGTIVGTYRSPATVEELPTWLEGAFDAHLRLPGLAEISADLPDVIADLLGVGPSELSAVITPEVVSKLQERPMPGNLGQLARMIDRARALAGEGPITAEHLPPVPQHRGAGRRLTPLERVERDAISAVLDDHDGNKAAAAQQLEMSRSTFYRRLAQLGIS